jgi:hypothetical protein
MSRLAPTCHPWRRSSRLRGCGRVIALFGAAPLTRRKLGLAHNRADRRFATTRYLKRCAGAAGAAAALPRVARVTHERGCQGAEASGTGPRSASYISRTSPNSTLPPACSPGQPVASATAESRLSAVTTTYPDRASGSVPAPRCGSWRGQQAVRGLVVAEGTSGKVSDTGRKGRSSVRLQ